MGKPNKTKRNPYGLTVKQKLVKDLIVKSAESGQGLKATEAHQTIYSVKDKAGASQLAHQNLNLPNFRQALLDGLTKRKILGKNSKTEKRIAQGLDATTRRPHIIDRDDIAFLRNRSLPFDNLDHLEPRLSCPRGLFVAPHRDDKDTKYADDITAHQNFPVVFCESITVPHFLTNAPPVNRPQHAA